VGFNSAFKRLSEVSFSSAAVTSYICFHGAMMNIFHNSKLYMELVMSGDLAASLIFMHVASTVEL